MDAVVAQTAPVVAAGTYPPVTIYTADDCHWCGKAKQYLSRRGVPFTEKNVEAEAAAAQEAIRLSGHRGVPVITVGAQVINGFRRGELDAALGLAATTTCGAVTCCVEASATCYLVQDRTEPLLWESREADARTGVLM